MYQMRVSVTETMLVLMHDLHPSDRTQLDLPQTHFNAAQSSVLSFPPFQRVLSAFQVFMLSLRLRTST